MNSLNILSARVSPPQTPTASRSNSYGNVRPSVVAESRSESREDSDLNEKTEGTNKAIDAAIEDQFLHEETPLLSKEHSTYQSSEPLGWHTIPKAICMGLFDSMRWVLSTLAAPGVYLIACLYNERGSFAPFSQILKLGTALGGSRGTSQSQVQRNPPTKDGNIPGGRKIRKAPVRSAKVISSNSSSSGLSSESESEKDPMGNEEGQSSSTSPRTRSKSLQNSEEISPQRRSIRIKLHNEDSVRHRNHRKTQSTSTQSNGSGTISSTEISPATLKSPTSPAASLLMTKYPRAPAPPRPLIPRRQPSYAITDLPSPKPPMKTLILDLDETLIHSMAKGGRMGTGHMVEVKLNTIVGAGGNASIGPQHPVLYFVHKRPHCDDFLRRICKWYNLVIFTASVQEYADPVIDWLEQERKFFSGRYYRQHCTYRHGAFIKDLSSVEPDLSKVMILDNSPLSYMFHQDNAIPIEGWINDPSDNDLLHLIPLLEALQYVTDVRAFLALRGGEDGKMA